ncbi:hypothetical protein L5G28_15460 [Gordonia sp. HY285]|uniref:hypothetical protein n=1 Tax=Gordonia liuliyuniae TaxID=2911517 RepID=UPI001F34EDB4|nr:hypothetical protein [Gordonia liuliyuniae]MCF8611545.1 hypothetical protein [Gordonia liuliyuniae]
MVRLPKPRRKQPVFASDSEWNTVVVDLDGRYRGRTQRQPDCRRRDRASEPETSHPIASGTAGRRFPNGPDDLTERVRPTLPGRARIG